MTDLTIPPPADDDKERWIPIKTFKQLSERGYRHIVMDIIAKGGRTQDIVDELKSEYGLEVAHGVAEYAFTMWGGKDAHRAVMLRELAELHAVSVSKMREFEKDYTLAKAANDQRQMKFLDEALRAWWDRTGKFHFRDAPAVAVQVNNNMTDPLKVLMEVAKDDPATLEKVLAKMRDTDTVDTMGEVKE